MATTSVDNSGSCEKGQVELSQSSRSSVSDYSEDTFESFSEEEAACCQHESEPPELCCSVEDVESSAVSDGLESTSCLTGQNHTDEQSEVVGSAAVERYFMRKWMDVLKNKEAAIKQGKSVSKTHSEVTELPDEELDALRSFCTVKIRRMHQGLISKQASGVRSRKLQHGFTSKKSETSDLNCTVPGQLMNRIRLKNIREAVKQVTEAQVHQSSQCPDCTKKKAELAEITFLRQKKALVESALLQEKLEEQIYSRDALTLIGETLRSFPKLSEDPRNLWQRLKDKGFPGIDGAQKLCLPLKPGSVGMAVRVAERTAQVIYTQSCLKEGLSSVNVQNLQLRWKDEGQKLQVRNNFAFGNNGINLEFASEVNSCV